MSAAWACGLPCITAGGVMGRNERRNVRERGALVQRLLKGVLQNPSLTLSVETLQAWLNVPVDAAERILTKLVSAGLVREVSSGVWVPGPLPGARPVFY
jgi:DNA-binding IclR family transcriptional regulator